MPFVRVETGFITISTAAESGVMHMFVTQTASMYIIQPAGWQAGSLEIAVQLYQETHQYH